MTITLFLVTILVGAFFLREGRRILEDEMRSRAESVARYLSAITAEDISTGDVQAIDSTITTAFFPKRNLFLDSDLAYLIIYNKQGDPLLGKTLHHGSFSSNSDRSPVVPGADRLAFNAPFSNADQQQDEPLMVREEEGIYSLVSPVLISGNRVGFLRVGITGKRHEERMRRVATSGAFVLLAVLVLGFVFSQIIAVSITRPISRLSAAADDLSKQNWKTPIPVTGKDEISTLGHTFNQMAVTLKQREASLSRGNRDLFILHTTGLDLMEGLDIDALLPKIAARADDLVRADTITVSTIDRADKSLKYIGVFGSKAQKLRDRDMPFEAGGIYNWLVSYGTPLLILDAQSDFRFDKEVMKSLDIRCLMAVPLWSSNRMTGFITAINKKGGSCFDKHDLRLFTVFSNMLSAALENASLYSDLKNHMRALEQTQQQLVHSTRMAAVGELAANIAHEINNPLTSVLGYTTQLLQTLDVHEEPKRMLEMMERETLRVRKIIRNLLDYSRRRQSWMQPGDILQPLGETLALIEGVANASSVRIQEEFNGREFIVNMDANEMKQVFINMVNNAVQAMPKGGELTVRAHAEGAHDAVIEFEDTGVGIPREDLARIFEPFYTARRDGNGTGLGLPISERIVQNHGGRIEVRSEVGKGSVFRVILPRSAAEPTREGVA